MPKEITHIGAAPTQVIELSVAQETVKVPSKNQILLGKGTTFLDSQNATSACDPWRYNHCTTRMDLAALQRGATAYMKVTWDRHTDQDKGLA